MTSDPLVELLMAMLGQRLDGSTPCLTDHALVDNYNVAPTMDVAVIQPIPCEQKTQELALQSMRWWLTPCWSKEVSSRYSMFNARSESLEKSSAYREPFKQRRCVVPVTGFYEWVREGGQKLPYYIRPADDRGMLLAGIWDSWRSREEPGADPLLSFSIVTTAVHPSLELVHNRQPVMLDVETAKQWMSAETPTETLKQLMLPVVPKDTLVIPVSSYVNNARHAGPRCIEPIGEIGETIEVPASR